MKLTSSIIVLLVLDTTLIYAQHSTDLVSLSAGYGTTNMVFREAFIPTARFLGLVFNPGNTFSADGPKFGISKELDNHFSLDGEFTSFVGHDTKLAVNNYANFYKLNGFLVPVTVNYLFRNKTKRLRINFGAGFQYLHARLRQFETVSNQGTPVTSQITDINIRELQFALYPGVQYRILDNIFISFKVIAALSFNGRYADNPSLTLKYRFQKPVHH